MKNSTSLFAAVKGYAVQLFLVLLTFLFSVNGVLGQTTVQIGSGNTRSSTVPIVSNFGYSYSENIYLASEFNSAGGTGLNMISKIRFYYNGDGSGTAAGTAINTTTFNNWKIYLGNTSKTTFTSTTNWATSNTLTEVFNGVVTFPAPGNWMEITLSTPFIWNGTSNIIVAVDENTPNFGTLAYWGARTASVSSRGIYYRSDTTNPDPQTPPTGTVSNNSPFIQFVASQSTPCTGTPTPGTIASNTTQNICSGTTPAVLTVTGTTSGVTGISYQWEQSSDNSTWTNAVSGTGATTASYTPPAFGGTTIYYRCKVTCTSSSLFDVTNVATIAPPSNPTTQASSLAFSSISYTGFTASWTNGNGNRRVVYISDASIVDPTNNTGAAALAANTAYSGSGQQNVFDGTGTSVTVTGLALGSTYNVKVIDYTRCGSNPYDNYFNLTSGTNTNTVTTSAASTVPWSEGFLTSTLPNNWVASSDYFISSTVTALNPGLSSNYIYVNLDGAPSTAALVTPIFNNIPNNYRFVVKYKLANYSSPYASPASGSGNFILAVSTNNGTTYTDVATIANNTVAGWQEYIQNLSAYVGQNIRIRLTGNYTSGDYYLAFDDFSIEPIPTCFVPTSIQASSISITGASIGWSAPSTGTSPSNYDYEVRTSGAAGSGATGLITSATVSTNTATVSGLTAATTYSVYVRSSCGNGDYSAWTSAFVFTTACEVPNNPGAISVSNSSSSGFTLTYSSASPTPTSYVLFNTTGTSSAATTIPTLVNGTNYANSTSYTFGGTSYNCITVSSASPETLTGGVSNTQYNYFLFSRNATNSCSGNPYFSSGVMVSAVTCAAAPTSPLTSGVTTNGATISWTASVAGGGYGTINYSLEVYTDAAFTAAIIGSPFSMSTSVSQALTGLSSSTTYYYRILANNGVCNSSYLTGSFSTSCAPISSFPSTFDFSTYLPNSCWAEATGGNATNGPNVNPNSSTWTGYGFLNSGTTGAAYINIYSSSANEWLISPQYNIPNGNFRVKYDVGATQYFATTALTTAWESDDNVQFLINIQGNTGWSILNTYDNNNVPSYLGQTDMFNLSAYAGQTVRFAFRVKEGNQNGSADIDFFIDNFTIEATPISTWTGTTNTNWATASNWSNSTLPVETNAIIIPSNVPNFPEPSVITIGSSGSVTLNSGAKLTISGTLTNNGTLTLESGATLVQGASSTLAGTGTYNVKQTITGANNGSAPSGRFWYLGSPVSLASSSVYFGNAANVVKKRDEVNNTWTALSSGTPENLVVGRGYYTQTMGNATVNFTGGLLNNGAITIGNLSRTAGQGFEGFNLVSNPYPSYLDWDAVTKTNVGNTMWYRTFNSTNNTMVFDTYVAGTGGIGTNLNGAGVSNLVPPMQSFWVRVNSGSTTGSLGLSNSMRAHFTSINGSVAGLKSTSNERDLFLRMNLLQANKKDQIIVYVNDIATNGFDQFDGEKMMQAGMPQFYTSATGKKITINGLNSAKKQQALPITMELPTTGVHSFVIEDLEISNGLVWLEDKQEEIMQALEPGTVYEFYANSGINTERFVLHFQLIDNTTPINVYNEVNGSANFSGKGASVHAESAGVVVIKLPATTEGVTDIQIRDAAGRLVYTGSTNTLETSVQLAQANGIYYVTLNSASGVEVRKVFIQQ